MNYQYLYRALRPIEIESGYKLIPKETKEFKSDPVFGIDNTFPMTFGAEINSVRQHQWNQNGLPTRGISSTPFYERALFYAQSNKVIVKIDATKFKEVGIKTFDVNECLKERPEEIAIPEDNEVIMVYENGTIFPSEIIEEIIHLNQG